MENMRFQPMGGVTAGKYSENPGHPLPPSLSTTFPVPKAPKLQPAKANLCLNCCTLLQVDTKQSTLAAISECIRVIFGEGCGLVCYLWRSSPPLGAAPPTGPSLNTLSGLHKRPAPAEHLLFGTSASTQGNFEDMVDTRLINMIITTLQNVSPKTATNDGAPAGPDLPLQAASRLHSLLLLQ
jgi:hypothetical protein